MRRNVRGLDHLGVRIDEIWTSPLLRARQTSELLAGSSHFHGTVRTVASLSPGGDPVQVLRELQQADKESVALVGHEPDMSELAGMLLTGRSASFAVFKKGGVACIEVDKPGQPLRGVLRWHATPKILRALH